MSEQECSNHFEQLVLDHVAVLYAVALRLTGSPDDAQRLTQRALMTAFRFQDTCTEATRIKGWLLTILRKTFMSERRPAVPWPGGGSARSGPPGGCGTQSCCGESGGVC